MAEMESSKALPDMPREKVRPKFPSFLNVKFKGAF